MNKKLFLIFLLLFLLIVPLADFFKVGLPVTHDGQDHVARIANFYLSLSEGNLIPRWAKNLNWGYGHPILMFLYPWPSYLSSMGHCLGLPLVDSVKATFVLSFILSGFFMFLWVDAMWGVYAGFVAGLIYCYAPYRFIDLFVRGAIGECWAFVWPPLILFAIKKLSASFLRRFFLIGTVAFAFLLLSHNALSLVFFPVIFFYFLFMVASSRPKTRMALIECVLLMFVLGAALSSFFVIPAFFEGKYTLRDIVTSNNINGFEPLSRLLWSSWSYGGTGAFSPQIGLVQWFFIVISPWMVYALVKRRRIADAFLLISLIIFFAGSVFLILPASHFIYMMFSILQKFQFAWRFLSLSVFIPPVIAGLFVFLFPKKLTRLIIMAIIVCSLLANSHYWRANGFLNKDEAFYFKPYPSTTDTGESAPIWSVRFMEKYPTSPVAVVEGRGKIKIISSKSNFHVFSVDSQERVRLVENTLYFPGWKVFVDGKESPIEFQDQNYRGLMTFFVPSGYHLVKVAFGDTKVRKYADVISIFAFCLLLATMLSWKRLVNFRNKKE